METVTKYIAQILIIGGALIAMGPAILSFAGYSTYDLVGMSGSFTAFIGAVGVAIGKAMEMRQNWRDNVKKQ